MRLKCASEDERANRATGQRANRTEVDILWLTDFHQVFFDFIDKLQEIILAIKYIFYQPFVINDPIPVN